LLTQTGLFQEQIRAWFQSN